ncbi:LysM peptidoglycan-binding and 3D domain-containing protein [Virgibacillus necropolis]|uniref:Cell wall-binding protein n=1 Tax=Virgibacillus necropolis TaxID=163877 RepID=A0A221M8K8_9BACI|nr:3D domain-containing protein [Virgibacillus necropolis]ASN03974.1 cell wall-binding protein [Virgibacillus necropolis]
MKKLVATLATGIIIAGAGMSSVSAEEYQVEKGDNLWEIAQENNTTVNDLVNINSLKSTVIHPKQKLVINEEKNEIYEVEKGDTLIGVGNKFGVNYKDIKEWNNLDSNLIVIGQKLAINGTANIGQEQVSQPAEAVETNAPVEAEAKTAEKTEPKKVEKPEPKTETAKVEKSNDENTSKESNPEGETITVSATAYTADCPGCSGVTYTGIDLNANPNAKVIAVDPDVIPLGTEVYVEGYGRAVAGDIGGGINGSEIDIHVGTKDEAYSWGVRTVDVTILN